MTPEMPPQEATGSGQVIRRRRGPHGHFADFDFRYVAHPALAISYWAASPVVMMASGGLSLEVLWWELIAGAMVAIPVVIFFRHPRPLGLSSQQLLTRLIVIGLLIVSSQVLARIAHPDPILESVIGERERGSAGAVIAAAIASYSLQQILLWLLFMVLVSGSLNHRRARKSQERLAADIQRAQAVVGSESPFAAKQRESVGEISRRVDAIERALLQRSGEQVSDLTAAVRELRQEVVRPSLEQLNALLAQARSASPVSDSVAASPSAVPWRWRGEYFSGSVGALLIAITGLTLFAPTAYYFPGGLVQLPLIALAFFVSVPAALLLFLAAALTPVLDPAAQSAGGWVIALLIVALGGISLLQRFNRVRQVRAVESMSVAGGQLALEQVRRAQDLKVIGERVNSIMHGSLQSTLLALELGLQSGDESVIAHSTEAIAHLRRAIDQLDQPTSVARESFDMALDNIISVWVGNVNVKVDQSPDAANAVNGDPLAASAVIEVVKEGTQNAVKHSGSREVRVVISHEDSLIRVRVSHLSSADGANTRHLGFGMNYLSAITRTLRLVDDGVTTTLYAEIPTHQTTII